MDAADAVTVAFNDRAFAEFCEARGHTADELRDRPALLQSLMKMFSEMRHLAIANASAGHKTDHGRRAHIDVPAQE